MEQHCLPVIDSPFPVNALTGRVTAIIRWSINHEARAVLAGLLAPWRELRAGEPSAQIIYTVPIDYGYVSTKHVLTWSHSPQFLRGGASIL